jgi:phosphate uptake regulator
METRKIQQVGGGTYTVSIPVHWANEHNIEAGNTAYLYTHRDGSLVVRWNEKEHSELATTDIELEDTMPEFAERMIVAAYSAGFKQIQLCNSEGFTTEQQQAIDTCIRSLTGIEITEGSAHKITIQELLDARNVSIRQSIIQLKHTTLSMHRAALDFLAGETTESEHIITHDDEADRIFRLIKRNFNRSLLDLTELDQLGITRPQLFDFYVTARQLERIADHAVKIVRCVQKADYTVSADLLNETRTIAADSRQVVENAFIAIIDEESAKLAHSALDDCERVVQEARDLDRTLTNHTPEEVYLLTDVLDSVTRTAEYGGNIAELALQNSLRT